MALKPAIHIQNTDPYDEPQKHTIWILGFTINQSMPLRIKRMHLSKIMKSIPKDALLNYCHNLIWPTKAGRHAGMKIPTIFFATTCLLLPANASRGLPADIETLDRLWQQYHMSCRQGDKNACQLRDNYQAIIKQNFPNAVPASCPPGIKRVWFETGRDGMRVGCKMY